jgi:hypothetical protein
MSEDEFFHISRKVPWCKHPALSAGQELTIGSAVNPYFNYYEEPKTFPVQQADHTFVQVKAMRFLNLVHKGQINPNNLPQDSLDVARHFMVLAREILWECVRKEKFSDLPSRQRCIWLASSESNVQDWLKRMECTSNYSILRVKARGTVHKADERLLLGDTESFSETINKAERYWSGTMDSGSLEEIIFEGKLTILEVMSERINLRR